MKVIVHHVSGFVNDIVLTDPQYLPRIGEQVFMGYSPAPFVTSVFHQYDAENKGKNEMILVLVSDK